MSVRSRRNPRKRTPSRALRSPRGTRQRMKVLYSARYHIDIGPHVFPTRKYPLVHARLLETGTIEPSDVVRSAPAGWDVLARVHTPEYLAKMRDGTLSPD